MIRARLQYHRPTGIEDASSLLAEWGDAAAILGGGTWLLPRMNRNETSADHIVDLRGLGLDYVRVENDAVEVGAMATYNDVLESEELLAALPLLPRVANGITGGNQIRNQGTLVGSACYANPSSDVPALLVALSAKLRLRGAEGIREVDASNFFMDAFEVDMEPGEFVASFVVPRRRYKTGYHKLKICEGSWPIATAVAVVDEQTGEATVTLGAVRAKPLTIDLGELRGTSGDLDVAGVADLVRERVEDPWGDIVAQAGYRRNVSGVVARRAIEELKEEITT